jgi:hypothetical protein
MMRIVSTAGDGSSCVIVALVALVVVVVVVVEDEEEEEEEEDEEDEEEEEEEEEEGKAAVLAEFFTSFRVGSILWPHSNAPHITPMTCNVFPSPIESAKIQPFFSHRWRQRK